MDKDRVCSSTTKKAGQVLSLTGIMWPEGMPPSVRLRLSPTMLPRPPPAAKDLHLSRFSLTGVAIRQRRSLPKALQFALLS